MKFLAFIAVLFMGIVNVFAESADWDTPNAAGENPVPVHPMINGTTGTFDKVIAENPIVLVEFYAKWCAVCKFVGPEFMAAAELARDLELPIKFMKVDIDEEYELTDRFEITTFPTFHLYHDGEYESFPVLQTSNAIVSGAAKVLGLRDDISPAKSFPADVDSVTFSQWLFWRGSNGGKIPTTLVFYDPPGLNSAQKEVRDKTHQLFETAAAELMKNPNFRFAHMTSPQVFADYELPTDVSQIVLYVNHDEGRFVFELTPEATPEELIKWMQQHAIPLAVDIDHKTLQRYRRNVKKLGLLFVTEQQVEEPSTRNKLVYALSSVAQRLMHEGLVERGQFTLGVTNGDKYKAWIEYYEQDPNVLPAFLLEDTETTALYAMDSQVLKARMFCDEKPFVEHIEFLVSTGVNRDDITISLHDSCGVKPVPMEEQEPLRIKDLLVDLYDPAELEKKEDGYYFRGDRPLYDENGKFNPGVLVYNANGFKFRVLEKGNLHWVDMDEELIYDWLKKVLKGEVKPVKIQKEEEEEEDDGEL